MSFQLSGKAALVTGATSGLGRAIAVRFAAEGAAVAAMGRDAKALRAVAEEIRRAGGRVVAIRGDVRREPGCRRAVRRAAAELGGIDLLVNAAGVFSRGGLDTTAREWDRLMGTNLRGLWLMTREAAPFLKRRKGAAIVNLSSSAGEIRPFAAVMPYCVSKAGVGMLTKCAALELAPSGVRVNGIAPGVVPTRLHRRGGMSEKEYAGFLERSAGLHPLGFLGSTEDVVEAALYLCTDRSRWVTGQTLVLDGGRTLVSPR